MNRLIMWVLQFIVWVVDKWRKDRDTEIRSKPSNSSEMTIKKDKPIKAPSVYLTNGLRQFHCVYPIKPYYQWNVNISGIKVYDSEDSSRLFMLMFEDDGYKSILDDIDHLYGDVVDKYSKKYTIPREIIVATIATESEGKAMAMRAEPGYVDDRRTPTRISAGLMQTLVSTARKMLSIEDPESSHYEVNSEWLLDPDHSIHVGALYIKHQYLITRYDPPLVAAAYNAGGIYKDESPENKWHMRCYPLHTGAHITRFVKWFNGYVDYAGISL